MTKFVLFFLLCSSLFAQTNSQIIDYAFSHAYVSIEGGEVYPFGDLVDAVDNTFYGGLGFRYAFWPNVDGTVMFHYSYFEPRPNNVPYDGVHQFSGKVGMDWHMPFAKSIVPGAGLTCNWTRADLDDNANKNELAKLPGGTLTDNETEFGWFARLNLVAYNFENFRIGFNFMWEQLWTLPKRSNMLYVGFYVERKLW